MELKEDMYVRTEEGKIFKTDGDKLYLNNDKKILYRLLTRIPHDTANYKVIKASHNIIDLIEVGDYVNGDRVTEMMIKMRDEEGVFGLPDYYKMFIDEIPIKSIVTKEAFKSMEYRLGDK